jgi:hypothetical protein
MHRRSDYVQFFAKAKGWALPVYAECRSHLPDMPSQMLRLSSAVPHLYLGLLPDGTRRSSTYVNVPDVLRPSPLNFIYRSLSGSVQTLDGNGISLSFLDFDAY